MHQHASLGAYAARPRTFTLEVSQSSRRRSAHGRGCSGREQMASMIRNFPARRGPPRRACARSFRSYRRQTLSVFSSCRKVSACSARHASYAVCTNSAPAAAISDTASGSVTIKGGISTNVTGLTANLTYYVQDNGTLATTTSSVLAGKALSSTSINFFISHKKRTNK